MRPGDELSIAHIRYRLENGQAHEQTIAEPAGLAGLASRPAMTRSAALRRPAADPASAACCRPPAADGEENALAAAVRKFLPAGLADKCRIQVIVQMPEGGPSRRRAPVR